MTNAEIVVVLAKISRLSAQATADLADSMWDPHFCTKDAMCFGISLHDDFRRLVDQLPHRREKQV